jgi:hypothetical protein
MMWSVKGVEWNGWRRGEKIVGRRRRRRELNMVCFRTNISSSPLNCFLL